MNLLTINPYVLEDVVLDAVSSFLTEWKPVIVVAIAIIAITLGLLPWKNIVNGLPS